MSNNDLTKVRFTSTSAEDTRASKIIQLYNILENMSESQLSICNIVMRTLDGTGKYAYKCQAVENHVYKFAQIQVNTSDNNLVVRHLLIASNLTNCIQGLLLVRGNAANTFTNQSNISDTVLFEVIY